MRKMTLWIIVSITGVLGGYIPVWLWQADPFDLWSILGGFIGALAGIWVWYKIDQSANW